MSNAALGQAVIKFLSVVCKCRGPSEAPLGTNFFLELPLMENTLDIALVIGSNVLSLLRPFKCSFPYQQSEEL